MRRFTRARRHGTQQHPHKVSIAANTAIDTNTEDTRARYLPNTDIHESHMEVSTPECSFIFPFRVRRPSMALVKLPSAAVLLGIKEQHCSPNIAHTPPFSTRSMSRAILFWNAIRDVAVNWPCTASKPLWVQLPNFWTL